VGIAGRAGFRQGLPYRCKPAGIPGFKYFDFEFKKLKNETKKPKNTSRFIESNSVKIFQIPKNYFRFIESNSVKFFQT
jgi:hypothetical protein